MVRRNATMFKLITVSLLALSSLLGITSSAANAKCESSADERVQVRMYRYAIGSGINPSDLRERYYFFYSLLNQKLDLIWTQLEQEGLNESFQSKLALEPSKFPQPFTTEAFNERASDLQDEWQNYRRYLLLIHGALDKDSAISNIFWGDLPKAKTGNRTVVRLKLSSEGYASASDSHSFLTLFALAMDAQRRKCHSSLVLHFLDQALEAYVDLETHGTATKSLLKIKTFMGEMRRKYVTANVAGLVE